MQKHLIALTVVFLTGLLIGCTNDGKLSNEARKELRALYQSKDYFALSEMLEPFSDSRAPVALYYKATVERAFNRPAESNRILNDLLVQSPLPDSLLVDAWTLKMENYLRLHDYEAAFQAADNALQMENIPEEKGDDIQNTRRIAETLQDIPPQTILKRDDTTLDISGTEIELTLYGQAREYIYDTGANYSVLIESEANEVGVDILAGGIDVGSVTGRTVKADLGVADSLTIGNMLLRNVVFLVLPDEALTFPGGFLIPGIIGFPVLEAMGELQFENNTLFVPQNVNARQEHNLVLDNLTPLISFTFNNSQMVGRFDTGANQTQFYQPFFNEFFRDTLDTSLIDTIRTGGAGGIVSVPVFELPRISIGIAGTTVTLDSVPIHTEIFGAQSDNYLYANIGLDLVDQFDGYILNFRDMAFIVK